MSAQTDIAAAKRFADGFKPSADDPETHSRVVMFRRAVESEQGTKRTTAQAVHARTLVRHLNQTGQKIPAAAKKSAPAAKKS